ncbi:MAG: hypothetical protein QM599_11410 [Pseudoxanthomonas sp.]
MQSETKNQQRRRLLQAGGGLLLSGTLLELAGCSKSGLEATATTGGSEASAATTSRWASGGTALIGDPARFPAVFDAAGIDGACMLTCMTTIGPCHTLSPERSDISDGWQGLPMRLLLRVVDADCKPVPGALVEIWHTNHTGGYSGRIVSMCNNDQDDLDKQFFRGYQRCDENGIVAFDTCYPGWYRSRAVHIHLRVMTGAYDADDRATTSVTTQLMFTDALNREIFGAHPLYKEYGEPDTLLDGDNVIGGETDKSRYLFDVQRLDDGVMLASKTLVIRSSLDAPVCEAKGNRNGPGGGPPPGPAPSGSPPGRPPGDHGDRPAPQA